MHDERTQAEIRKLPLPTHLGSGLGFVASAPADPLGVELHSNAGLSLSWASWRSTGVFVMWPRHPHAPRRA
jgi:hypothetical protein